MDTQNFFSTKNGRVLGALVLVSAIIALLSYAYSTLERTDSPHGPTTINVRGEAEVLARPDIGTFSFSVQAEAEDAAAAQSNSAEAVNAIITYLTDAGVAEADIKTEYYNLNPQYRYNERVCPAGSFCPPGERELTGYQVSQNLSVKVRDLDTAGDLISGVGERGATNISSLQFTIDDESVLQAEAREAAIADAKEKARELAEDLGVRLVRVTGFFEEQGGYPTPYGLGGDAMMERSVMSDGFTPQLPTGENTIRSVVTIMYEVK